MKRLIISILMVVLLFTFAGCSESESAPPAVFSLSNLAIEPTEAKPNETVTISVSVFNTSSRTGTHDVVLIINGMEEETKSVTVHPRDREHVIFGVTRGDVGTYTVTIENLSDLFSVMLSVSVKIEATASTWREGEEPYNIYDAIESKLASAGVIKVVSEDGKPYDALLSVEYREIKGSSYMGGGYGTTIRCILELHDNMGNLLFEKEIWTWPQEREYLSGNETLYSKSLDYFKEQNYYKYLSEVIINKLGVVDKVPMFITNLNPENNLPGTRLVAAEILGVLGDNRAVEPLIQTLLADEDFSIRKSAAKALGEIGDARAVEDLTQALEDDNESVRDEAEQALEKIQGT